MPLGVTYSGTATDLISGGGKMLAESIRSIGKEISAITQRQQVNRDVESLGQELSAIDPNTPDYMQKLAAVSARHPMALQSEAGQMILKSGIEANRGWQREQLLQDRISGMESVARIRGDAARDIEDIRARSRLEAAEERTRGRIQEAQERGATAEEVARIRAEGQQEVARIRNERPIPLAPGATAFDWQNGVPLFSAPDRAIPDRSSPTGTAKLSSIDRSISDRRREMVGLASDYRKIRDDDEKANERRVSIFDRITVLKGEIEGLEKQKNSMLNPIPERSVPGSPMLPTPDPELDAAPVGPGPQGGVPEFYGPPMPAEGWAPRKTRVVQMGGKSYEVDDEAKAVLRELQ